MDEQDDDKLQPTNTNDQQDQDQISETQIPSDASEAESTQPVTEDQPTVVAKKRRRLSKRVVIMAVAVLLLLGGGAAAWYVIDQEQAKPAEDTSVVPEPIETETEPTASLPEATQTEKDILLDRFVSPTTGETWLPTPKKLSDQGYFRTSPDYQIDIPEYYEVGSRAGNKIIMSVLAVIGDDIRLYEKSADGTVTFISRPDGDYTYNEDYEKDYPITYADGIIIDKTIHYDSLTLPRTIDLGDGYSLKKRGDFSSLGDFVREDSQMMEQVKKLGQSTILKTETTYADTNLTSIGYVIQLPTNTRTVMLYEPLELDLIGYEWQHGLASGDTITAIARGCGGWLAAVTRSDIAKDEDFQLVGKSPSGQMVYEAKDPNYPLVTKAYDEFVDFYNVDGFDYAYKGISKDEFLNQHGILFYKDKSGQWLVFVRSELRPDGGCAKPVVYLYPTQAQEVKVRVGADVKISEPFYNLQTGWRAWALPNGQLTVNGQQYGSLFWEGPGHGAYPSITSGTVVSRDQAAATILSQLKQQGLNKTEIEDFMTYWQDKIPAKPYIRLTWFNTAQMDTLAPLYVSPKPDTVIRVFLDMDGFDSPISLPAQQLRAIPRNGFTVVEWGGLAQSRLY